jgi:hypothetical protein
MDETSTSLCEQLYDASLVLLDKFGTEPELCESQIQHFMRSQPYREFLFAEILRIALQQNYVPCAEDELTALHGYANVMAEVMLRGIAQADYTQRNYALEKRQN